MKPRTVWAVYFSATGTTAAVVEAAAKEMGRILEAEVQVRPFTLPCQRQEEMLFSTDDLVVFGTPVYAGRVPNLMVPYLREKVQGRGALAVPVVLYGNREYDDALVELRDILEQDGFHTTAAAAFIGEHSFSRVLAAGRPDASDMAAVTEFARRAADKVAALPALPAEPIDLHQEEHQWEYYQPRDEQGNPINILKVKPKTDAAKCTRCGVCAGVCPMGSISAADVSVVSGVCIKCCACVKGCPAGAKYFDDPGYELHRQILERRFARRADPVFFF